jgi:tetratricopeptide (TPR) repeat protein
MLVELFGSQAVIAEGPNNQNLYKQAVGLAQAGKLSEAEEPLNILLAQANDQVAQLLMFRGKLRAQSGRFQDAADDLEQIVKTDPVDHGPWFILTPLLVQTGETANYRANCKEMLRIFNDTTDGSIAERVAKSCLLAPSALDPEDVKLAAKLADKSVALTKEGEFWPWRRMTKGLAEYRQGQFAQASETIDVVEKEMRDAENAGRGAASIDTCKADSYLISAMAHYQLKESAQAQAALDQARAIVRSKLPDLNGRDLGPSWWDVLMTYILMSEASKTVGGWAPGQQ